MKIRIKDNSIRIRLTKSEVAKLVHEGQLDAETSFVGRSFRYAVKRTSQGSMLSGVFEDGMITLFVPQNLIQDWDTNAVVSIESNMPVNDGQNLYLLLEKDFQCIDQSTEDQSDNYTNPNQIC